jgi:hypothetical protein
MIRVLPSAPIRIAGALVALTLLACSQGEGESCQANRDCEDGLFCVLAANSPRGVCRSPEDIDEDMGAPDAGEPELPPDDDDAGSEPAPPDETDAGSEPAQEDAGG